jgi:MoxR-like ATPase
MDNNITKISVEELKKQLELLWQLKETILITGPVGIGKTTIISDFALSKGISLQVFILSQVDALDLRGIPTIKDGAVEWCPPNSLPLQENKSLALSNCKKFIIELANKVTNTPIKELLLQSIEQIEPLQVLKEGSSTVINTLLTNIKELDLGVWLELNTNKSIRNLLNLDKEEGILFFDELFNATYDTQAAIQQLLQERRIGEYELKPGWVVWAAANLVEHDVPNTHQNSAAIKDRVTHFSLECRTSSVIDYATEHNWHDTVISFLMANPNHIHGKEEGYPFDTRESNCFPTPRSWEKVSQLITHCNGDIEKCFKSVEGRLGTFTTQMFSSHITKICKLPPLEEFLCGDEKKVLKLLSNIKDLGTLYSLFYRIQAIIDTQEILTKALLVPIICFEQGLEGNKDLHPRAIEVGSKYTVLYIRLVATKFNLVDPTSKEVNKKLLEFYNSPIGKRAKDVVNNKGSLLNLNQ